MSFLLVVGLQPATLRLGRGESADVEVVIRNVSDVVEHYAIEVLGLGTGDLVVSLPPETQLLPKESAQVRLRIGLPAVGGPPAGQHVLAIRVFSPQQSLVSRAEELVLDVPPVAAAALEIQPQVQHASPAAEYVLTVRNDGNFGATLTFIGTDPEASCTFQFDPDRMALQPASSATSKVVVRERRPLTGNEKRHPITVRAMMNEQVWGEAAAEVVVKPRIPIGAILAVGALVLVAVLSAPAVVLGMVLGKDDQQGPPGGAVSSADAPYIAQINVSPPMAQTGSAIVFAASVSGTVETWQWQILDVNNAQVVSSDEPSQFEHVFTAGGTFQVKLTVTGPDGTNTSARPFSIADVNARFKIARTDVPANPGELVTGAVECSEGEVVLGSGAVATPADGSSTLVRSTLSAIGVAPALGQSTPAPGRSRATLRYDGVERGVVSVVAVCAEPFPGHQVVTNPLSALAGGWLSRAATCPAGSAALGGGMFIPFGPGDKPPVIQDTGPSTLGGGAKYRWLTSVGNAPSELTMVAVCATKPDDYEIAQDVVALPPDKEQLALVACPFGKQAVAGGARVIGEGAGDDSGTVVTGSSPDLALDDPMARWRVGLRNDSDNEHTVAVVAVCLPKSPG